MKWQLARMALLYIELYDARDHVSSVKVCEAYGKEAGRRVVHHQIPHTGYWFEYR